HHRDHDQGEAWVGRVGRRGNHDKTRAILSIALHLPSPYRHRFFEANVTFREYYGATRKVEVLRAGLALVTRVGARPELATSARRQTRRGEASLRPDWRSCERSSEHSGQRTSFK